MKLVYSGSPSVRMRSGFGITFAYFAANVSKMVVSTGNISGDVGHPTIALRDRAIGHQVEKHVAKVSDFYPDSG